MHPYLNIAVSAARRAGNIIIRYMEQVDTLKIQEKGINDFVTSVDKAAEEDIITTIRKAYPHHGILGEETGHHPGDELQWIIDPLDGTMNYIHGYPHFAVSIAIKQKNLIEHAVVYDPFSQDLFTASRGAGAKLNDKRIRVANRQNLEGSLIGTAFPAHNREDILEHDFKIFKEVFHICADLRIAGSAALNLAFIAAGRLDGFWEADLKVWDIAAGILLVKEAGGMIGDFKGGNDYLESGNIIAGNKKVYGELLKIIQEHNKIR